MKDSINRKIEVREAISDGELQIESVTEATQSVAKELILEGLAERFGFIDYSLNPDLNNIVESYIKEGDIFLTGSIQGKVLCTGALIKEETYVGRIARMSVKKVCRRQGFARLMLKSLVVKARAKGYTRLVLETNVDWMNAIQFYISCGFNEMYKENGLIHMTKDLK